MALEHDRLTPEETTRVVDLAARLQAEHERTYDVSEVAHAASEAGIDPRFIEEAARRIRTQPHAAPAQVGKSWRGSPWTLAVEFAAVLALGTFYADPGFRASMGNLNWILPAFVPGAFALAFRYRRASIAAPPILSGLAFFLGIVVGSCVLAGQFHIYGAANENVPLILIAALSALFATLVGSLSVVKSPR